MTTSVDSSALVPVYVTERFSNAARAAVQAASQVPFTPLHELEVRNAFEPLVGRRLITRDEYRAIADQLQEDIETQRLMTLPLDLDDMPFNMHSDAILTATSPSAGCALATSARSWSGTSCLVSPRKATRSSSST